MELKIIIRKQPLGENKENIALKTVDGEQSLELKCIETCYFCDFQSKRKSYLEAHVNNTHVCEETFDGTTAYKCSLCSFRTKYKHYLKKKHMIVHRSANETEIFTCSDCRFKSKHKQSLQTHIRVTHKNPQYKCCFCDFYTNRSNRYGRHMYLHEKPYRCIICNFETNERQQALLHNRKHNCHLEHETKTGTGIYKCSLCTFSTRYKYYMKKHMIIHKMTKETEIFKCFNCEFETKHKQSLIVHMNGHRNPRYKCHFCDYNTNRSSYFTKHTFDHMEKPFSICKVETNQRFSQMNMYNMKSNR